MNWTLLTNFLIAMFAIVNPLGKIPLFVQLTDDEHGRVRVYVAALVTACAVLILILFHVFGGNILNFFGVDMPSFQIAGGVVIFMVGIRMINGTAANINVNKEKKEENPFSEAKTRFRHIFVPMSMPMIAGPGALTTVILYGRSTSNDWKMTLAMSLTIAVCGFLIFLTLVMAHKIRDWVGALTLEVVTRLFGLILAAIAAQFVVQSVGEVYPNLGWAQTEYSESESRMSGADQESGSGSQTEKSQSTNKNSE